jgi:small GTP-binding protein
MGHRHRIVFLGDAAVGKTTLASRLSNSAPTPGYTPTISTNYFSVACTIHNSEYEFDIWDTAGQERYQSIIHSYCRDVAGAWIVFDVTIADALNRIKDWMNLLRSQSPNAVVVLFGNKTDLDEDRKVFDPEATACADGLGIEYHEGSALTGEGIHDSFSRLAEACVNAARAPPEIRGANLAPEAAGTNGFCCG